MNYRYYARYINSKTTGRYDVTPIFEQPRVFSQLLRDLAKPFHTLHYDKIVGLDALGFIIGGAMAQVQHIGFVAMRKGGKLPGIRGTVARASFVDYTRKKKQFEVNRGAIRKGESVIIIDDWIETGGQIRATIKLIERLGGTVAGISVICAHRNTGTRILFDSYHLKALKIVDEDE